MLIGPNIRFNTVLFSLMYFFFIILSLFRSSGFLLIQSSGLGLRYQLNNVSHCMSCLKLELFELKSATFLETCFLSKARLMQGYKILSLIDETRDGTPTCRTLTTTKPNFYQINLCSLKNILNPLLKAFSIE